MKAEIDDYDLDSYLNADDYARLRHASRNDLWRFVTSVIGNDGYDPYFHKLICHVYMHTEPGCPTYPPGDYYWPTRNALADAGDSGAFFTPKYRISYPTTTEGYRPADMRQAMSLTTRLRKPPTAMDGTFRGVFVRLTADPDIKVYMVPRAHLKSTLLTREASLWDFARDPMQTIALVMNSGENVKKQVAGIKSIMQGCERLQRTFPELIPEWMRIGGTGKRRTRDLPLRWKATSFDVPQNDDERLGIFRARVEESFVGTGVDARLVSQHYSRIKFDDLADDKNTRTPERIQATIQSFQAIESLGIGDITKKHLVGTPWDYGDVNMWVLDPKLSGFDTSTVLIATIKGTDDEVFFAKDFTKKTHPGFTKRRDRQLQNRARTSHLYSSQYLMQPVDQGRQSFQASWWRFFDPSAQPWAKRAHTTVITLDPAISEKKQGDYSAFVVVKITDHGFWYVLDIQHHRALGAHGIVDMIFELNDQYRPDAFGVEGVSFQRMIQDAIYDRAMTQQRAIPPIEMVYPSTTASKEFRIKRIAPRVEQGMVWLPMGDPSSPPDVKWQRPTLGDSFQQLISQGERFPRVTNDDILDALSMVLDVNFVPATRTEVHEETLVDRVLRDSAHRQRYEESYAGNDPMLGSEW